MQTYHYCATYQKADGMLYVLDGILITGEDPTSVGGWAEIRHAIGQEFKPPVTEFSINSFSRL